MRSQRQDRRRNDQYADGIAQPPVAPQTSEALQRLHASQRERCDTNGRTNRRAGDSAERDERHDIPYASKAGVESNDPAQEPRRGNGLEGVAGRDNTGSPDRCDGAGVRDERADPNRGPERWSPQQQRRETDPRWCPDRRDLLGDERKPEADERGGDVGDGDGHAGANQSWCNVSAVGLRRAMISHGDAKRRRRRNAAAILRLRIIPAATGSHNESDTCYH